MNSSVIAELMESNEQPRHIIISHVEYAISGGRGGNLTQKQVFTHLKYTHVIPNKNAEY